MEVEDFEKLVEDFEGYKHNKQNRKKREGEEELYNDAPKMKKKKHKSKENKDNKRAEEDEAKMKKKKKKHKSKENKDNKRRSAEEDERIQSDAPKLKKKKKHKSEKTKENIQRSVEEEDIKKHVEDLEGYKQEKENRKRKAEEVKVQSGETKKKKKKKLKNGKQFEELEDGDKDVSMEEEKNRKEGEQEELEHEHQRKKKKKKSKRREERINNDESNSEESMEDKSKNKKKGENLQNTKSAENPKLLENVPDKENELKSGKSKRSKKKNAKVHPEGVLPYDEDVNPIHFDWNPSEEIKQKFKIRQGRWTKQEEEILRENMEQYLLENDLDDPSKLIFAHLHSDSDEERKWKEFAKTTNFYRKLGKGLNRSIFYIYRKVLRSFNQDNYIGKFTESEDNELEKLVTVHQKKWEKIGRIMGRSGLAVRHRYSRIIGTRGKWEDKEVDLLKEAVRKVTYTTEGEEVFTNINWTAVASIVKTRNAHQCRRKWLSQICWKECKSPSNRKWDYKDDLKLIKLVYESSATGEYDIDWNELQKHFEMARSPAWLNAKFKVLLKKYCDSIDLENTDFEDIMDYLYNVKRKVLEDKSCDHQDSISE